MSGVTLLEKKRAKHLVDQYLSDSSVILSPAGHSKIAKFWRCLCCFERSSYIFAIVFLVEQIYTLGFGFDLPKTQGLSDPPQFYGPESPTYRPGCLYENSSKAKNQAATCTTGLASRIRRAVRCSYISSRNGEIVACKTRPSFGNPVRIRRRHRFAAANVGRKDGAGKRMGAGGMVQSAARQL